MSDATPHNVDVITGQNLELSNKTNSKSSRRGSRQETHVLRDLLFVLTWRDVKIRYKQSVMGLMWAILMPAIIVGAGMLVRVAMSELSGEPLSSNHLATMSVKALP